MSYRKRSPWVLWLFLALILLVGGLFVFGLARFYFSAVGGSFESVDRAGFGQLGDFFGGTINPVVGFVTIFLLILTILIQGQELRLTRDQLEIAASAQTKSEAHFGDQAATMSKQLVQATLSAEADLFVRVVAYLQDPKVVAARRVMHRVIRTERRPFDFRVAKPEERTLGWLEFVENSNWRNEEILSALEIGRNFDVVGMILTLGQDMSMSRESTRLVVENWADVFIQMWEMISPIVEHRRIHEGRKTLWASFERLYHYSKEWAANRDLEQSLVSA